MTETTLPAGGPFQAFYRFPIRLNRSGDNQLRNPVAPLYGEFLGAVINQKNFNLPAIIAVYSPRRVEHGYSETRGDPASGPDLRFKSFRQSNLQAGGNRLKISGTDNNFSFHCGQKIHTHRPGGHVLW